MRSYAIETFPKLDTIIMDKGLNLCYNITTYEDSKEILINAVLLKKTNPRELVFENKYIGGSVDYLLDKFLAELLYHDLLKET